MIAEAKLLDHLQALGLATSGASLHVCQGGDIHQSYRLQNLSGHELLFIKVNTANHAAVLRSEFQSLEKMAELFDGGYPLAMHFYADSEFALLAMRYHELEPLSSASAGRLGRLLATQHSVTHSSFGWYQENHIGLTPQTNDWHEKWPDFFWRCRLTPMLENAIDAGLPSVIEKQVASLEFKLDRLLGNSPMLASLLHGDLWVGNASYDATNGSALLYDPAPYFGDPDVDLAMSELFGQFPATFYSAYHDVHPRRAGYEERKSLYNLYHALNHFVLFGSGYLSLVKNQLQQLAKD